MENGNRGARHFTCNKKDVVTSGSVVIIKKEPLAKWLLKTICFGIRS